MKRCQNLLKRIAKLRREELRAKNARIMAEWQLRRETRRGAK